MVPFRFDVVRAGRALSALLKDPDDLPQVFTLIESISGTAHWRLVNGFERDPSGQRLLRDKPDIVAILADRERLRALPEGTLGRAYLAFVESENISAQGIRDASLEGRVVHSKDQRFAYVSDRMRDTHDLWHALTGYKGDVLGELSLLAFNLAQHWNSAVALIVVAAILKGYGRADFGMVLDGYKRGRRVKAWLPAADWESLIAMPLSEVRTKLGIEAVPAYTPLRSADLRAQGLVGA
jgi:ubiquinone biosynthesis protein COQ4